jgi:hypothetical protein
MNRVTLLAFAIIVSLNISASNEVKEKKQTVFSFPSEKVWKHLETPEKRKAMLQIPSPIVSEIPTAELIDACLDYPYLLDFLFYDSYQEGIDVLAFETNSWPSDYYIAEITIKGERFTKKFSIKK